MTMGRSRVGRALVILAVLLLIVGASVWTTKLLNRPSAPGAGRSSTTGGGGHPPSRQLSLAAAIASSRDLGPLPAGTNLDMALALKLHDASRLQELIASGQTVSPATFDADFSPSQTLVQAAIDQLAAGGLRATWTAGSSMLQVSGPAGAASRLFGVNLHRYALAHGGPFYAPTTSPTLTGAISRAATAILGLDDYQQIVRAASTAGPESAGGYAPAEVLGAYGFNPLYQSGLSGKGETIIFVEIDQFQSADLEQFRQAFKLPPLNVHVARNFSWGAPAPTAGEADLDLEIAHAVAPNADLIVYYSGPRPSDVARAFAAATRDHPNAIFSVSLGECEAGPSVQSSATAWDTSLQRLAGTGGTAFVASGDKGAFTCGPDDNGDLVPTISSPADDPYATSVGGTTLFVGADNNYEREAGWGLPIEQVGSGGGNSVLWKRPAYQSGPGVANSQSTGMRQLPDVASLGDALTGWDICTDHGTSSCWVRAAGTSAGAPLWAALAALINESAVGHGVKRVGFLNPALYTFAQNPTLYPAPAFHDITFGNNLYYNATPGWDYVTGLGTPNASGLANDFLAYEAGR